MAQSAGRMNKRDRVQAVLDGREVDRAPFTFWYHFPADQVAGEACARAHLDHYRRHRLDLLKVMNDNGYPGPEEPLRTADDLKRMRPSPVMEPEFQNQLEALSIIRDELGDEAFFITTLFNPLSVLDSLSEKRAIELIRADEKAAGDALAAIAQTLGDFAAACITAGAAGVFMSCSDRALNAALGRGTYRRLVAPHDAAIFNRVEDAPLNVVHVHERADDFDLFLDYSARVVNWADRTDGPSIAEAAQMRTKVFMCGMDHVKTVVEGGPEDMKREIEDAVEQADGHPLIIAPGCSFPSDAPEANLQAVYDALAT